METKKELQKALDNYNNHVSLDYFYNDVKDIVARMPDGETKPETKPEPTLLEVAMNIFCDSSNVQNIRVCFDRAEELIAENERRKK